MLIHTKETPLGFDLNFSQPSELGYALGSVKASNDTSQFTIAFGNGKPVITMTSGNATIDDYLKVIDFLKEIDKFIRLFYHNEERLEKRREEFSQTVIKAAKNL